jgi:multisubunit Na+/H+ antiporter MnhB subunit
MDGPALILLDALLILVLLGLAWATLESRDPRRGVVLFIAFGLVLALVWARLAAPDVALAEAAIGAGLSGALLLAALRDEPGDGSGPGEREPAAPAKRRLPGLTNWALGLLCLGLGLVVAWAFVDALAGAGPERLAGQVLARIGESGVSNPVTAVLLNFRGYDTLLELAVLLAALLGILALGPERGGYAPAGPVLSGLAGWLIPALILTGGYLLWVGAHAPGGAFQAGAILAAAAVIRRLAGDRAAGLPQGLALRALSLAGVAVFLGVGLALLVAGRPFLGFPPTWAGTLILAIESAATLAIGATLALAFVGGRPAAWDSPQQRRALGPTQVRNQP